MIFPSGNPPAWLKPSRRCRCSLVFQESVLTRLHCDSLTHSFTSMATLWSKISALLPLREDDFPLQFSDRVEPSVVEVLRRCRRLLYQESAGGGGMLQAQILLDYSWEKLNSGTWRHVDKDWRRVYSYGCLFRVAALCRQAPSAEDVLRAVRTCDMALLMGAAIMEDILQRIVHILQREVREPTHDEHPEAKVGGLLVSLIHGCFVLKPAAVSVPVLLRRSGLAGVKVSQQAFQLGPGAFVSSCWVIPPLTPRLCLKPPALVRGCAQSRRPGTAAHYNAGSQCHGAAPRVPAVQHE